MTGAPPLVSILIPSFNRRDYVLEALESVRLQDFSDYELIIIDDASSDGSPDVIEAWLREHAVDALFVKHEKNGGVVPLLNEFAERARGKYLTWCSCDDVWLPGKLRRQVEAIESATDDVALVCGNCERIDGQGKSLGPLFADSFRFPEDPYSAILATGIVVATPNSLVRKSALDAVGRWRAEYLQDDFDLWLRITRSYRTIYLPEPGVKYRQLQDSFGKSRANAARFALDALRLINSQPLRHERERLAARAGREKVIENFYANAPRDEPVHRDPAMRALLREAGTGSAKLRMLSLCIRSGVAFPTYWTGVKLVRRVRRLFGFEPRTSGRIAG
jgi:glycosyltransferase involved in cell wall biosynthesis